LNLYLILQRVNTQGTISNVIHFLNIKYDGKKYGKTS